MPNFRDELNNAIVLKDDLIVELQKEFDEVVDCIINKALCETHKRIKDDLLSKAKSGQYEIIDSKKVITGFIDIGYKSSSYIKVFSEHKLSYLWNIVGYGNMEGIKYKFFNRYPDINIWNYQGENWNSNEIRFDFVFVNSKRKSFFSLLRYDNYYIFNITNAGENFIMKLKEKTKDDGIFVDFAYIKSGSLKLPNGGNNKKDTTTPIGNMVIKYTINF